MQYVDSSGSNQTKWMPQAKFIPWHAKFIPWQTKFIPCLQWSAVGLVLFFLVFQQDSEMEECVSWLTPDLEDKPKYSVLAEARQGRHQEAMNRTRKAARAPPFMAASLLMSILQLSELRCRWKLLPCGIPVRIQ